MTEHDKRELAVAYVVAMVDETDWLDIAYQLGLSDDDAYQVSVELSKAKEIGLTWPVVPSVAKFLSGIPGDLVDLHQAMTGRAL